MSKVRSVFALASSAVWLTPRLAFAQDAVDQETIGQFANLIRWSGVVTSLFVIAGAWLALRLMRGFVEQLSEQFTGYRLLLHKLATFAQFIIYLGTGAAVILLSFRIDDKVLALIGGTAAVSVGFAVKDVVASFIAGIMIMIDRPFQVGDRVSFGGEYGDIQSIGLRSVRMQTLDDNTVTIPNNKFLNEITSNGNYGALDMQVSVDFFIGVDQDLRVARRLVNEAALTSRYIFLEKPVTVAVSQVLQDSYVALKITCKAYVLDTRYEKAFSTDVHVRVWQAFRDRGIAPPAILHRQHPSGTEDPLS
jgi:small-conductance mechanosensitive channel